MDLLSSQQDHRGAQSLVGLPCGWGSQWAACAGVLLREREASGILAVSAGEEARMRGASAGSRLVSCCSQWVRQPHGPCPGSGCREVPRAPVGVCFVTFDHLQEPLLCTGFSALSIAWYLHRSCPPCASSSARAHPHGEAEGAHSRRGAAAGPAPAPEERVQHHPMALELPGDPLSGAGAGYVPGKAEVPLAPVRPVGHGTLGLHWR